MPLLGGLADRFAELIRPTRHRPRLARRVVVHCPHTGTPVEIDLEMGDTGWPRAVLRCSARPDAPPRCDQACRTTAEAVAGPARMLLILPPDGGAPEELD